MPVWCVGLAHTAVFRSLLLPISTHSIITLFIYLKVFIFHLHFDFNLYRNLFWYAIPLHSPCTFPLPQPFLSYRSTLSIYLACLPNPPFILVLFLHIPPCLSSLSPFLSHSLHTQMGTVVSHFSSLHSYSPFSICLTKALP